MSRYIDADAIKDKAWKVESEAYFYAFEDVVSITDIDSAPSIDIIRCKNCIYYEALGYDAPKDGWCNTPKLYCDGFWVDEDDFCSDAKREDEQ